MFILKLKKIISFLLAFCIMLAVLNVSAFAEGGYGENSGDASDKIAEPIARNYCPEYAAAYNDFENIVSYSGGSGFVIEETGDALHGKAFCVPAKSSSAVPSNNLTNVGTYSRDNKTYKLFYEDLVPDEDYIFSFEYWSDPHPASGAKTEYLFSIAPKHTQFWTGLDYRYYPKYYKDNLWHLDEIAFTAGANGEESTSADDKLNLKINTVGANIKSYIDNYLVMKAGEFKLQDSTGCLKPEILSGKVIFSEDLKALNGKSTFALGTTLKFKLISNTDAVVVDAVKMGDEEIIPDADGVYTVKAVDDIVITSGINDGIIKSKYTVDDDNNIYFEEWLSPAELASSIGAESSLVSVSRNGSNIPEDAYLSANDKISYSVGDAQPYNARFIGDVAGGGDGKLTVSDILSFVDVALDDTKASELPFMYDLDKNGKITVSDVVFLRKNVLKIAKEALAPDEETLGNMKDHINDVLSRSGIGADMQNMEDSVYNQGNRVRIANVIRKAMRGEDITIVYFGGSITATAGHNNSINSEFKGSPAVTSQTPSFSTSITETGGYVGWVTKWFKTFFPDAKITVHNSGIGSTTTPIGIHRMVEDVLEKKPDFVINEWACNDDTSYHMQGTYEAVARRLLENDIAVLLYGFSTRSGATTQELHKTIADFYNIPFVSYKDAFFTNEHWQYLTNDGTHPNIVGHALAGATMNSYLTGIYENIDEISAKPQALPKGYFHSEAHYYSGAYMANFKDIYDGKIEGVKITSMGSFEFDSKTTLGCRSFIPVTARYSASFQPMVVEIDACKTMFVLNKFISPSLNPEGTYYLKLNGTKITDPKFTSSYGSSTGGYMWATPLIMYDQSSPRVTLEIHPNFTNSNSYVTLFSLLLS